jgi:hypothetical protein
MENFIEAVNHTHVLIAHSVDGVEINAFEILESFVKTTDLLAILLLNEKSNITTHVDDVIIDDLVISSPFTSPVKLFIKDTFSKQPTQTVNNELVTEYLCYIQLGKEFLESKTKDHLPLFYQAPNEKVFQCISTIFDCYRKYQKVLQYSKESFPHKLDIPQSLEHFLQDFQYSFIQHYFHQNILNCEYWWEMSIILNGERQEWQSHNTYMRNKRLTPAIVHMMYILRIFTWNLSKINNNNNDHHHQFHHQQTTKNETVEDNKFLYHKNARWK